jgi:hypothetical protein
MSEHNSIKSIPYRFFDLEFSVFILSCLVISVFLLIFHVIWVRDKR